MQSAGGHPVGLIHPQALAVLHNAGIPTEGLASKSWEDFPIKPSLVITLCSNAETEPCPLYFGDVIRSHWGMPDPAKISGSDAHIEQVFCSLCTRCKDVLVLCVPCLTRKRSPIVPECRAPALNFSLLLLTPLLFSSF